LGRSQLPGRGDQDNPNNNEKKRREGKSKKKGTNPLPGKAKMRKLINRDQSNSKANMGTQNQGEVKVQCAVCRIMKETEKGNLTVDKLMWALKSEWGAKKSGGKSAA